MSRRTLRRYARRDQSEPAILQALSAYGFSWMKHNGRDEPDDVIGKDGITMLVEVKTGEADLTPAQEDFWATWKGNRKIVLRDVEDVRELAMVWRLLESQPHIGDVVAYHRHRRGEAGTA